MSDNNASHSLDSVLHTSASLNQHARQCKKHLADCDTCKTTIAWYRGLSLPLLAQVLQDRPTSHTR